jgi:hypothetical protein
MDAKAPKRKPLRGRTAHLQTAKSCGPDASTLAFKSAEAIPPMTVTKKPDRRGEREGNR